MDELLTIDQAAAAAGVSRAAIYDALRAGKITSTPRYGKTLIAPEELAKYKPRAHAVKRPGQGRKQKDAE